MFQPKILQPSPDPSFIRELKKIDPELRVVWGFERYFRNCWAIERRMSPERYFRVYESLLSTNEPRFVKQPIWDTDQPVYDDNGNHVGFRCLGYRDFDLAPEWEWMTWADTLDSRVILELKKSYAWNYTHPYTRRKFEEAEREAAALAKKKKRVDAALEGVTELENRAKNTVMVTHPGLSQK